MQFEYSVGGAANTYEVRLLDHATIVSEGEIPASAVLGISGSELLDGWTDRLHLYVRDTRYQSAAHPQIHSLLRTCSRKFPCVMPSQKRIGHENFRPESLLFVTY